MANKTKITVEPGKQEIFITREFDAPGSWFLKHTQIRSFMCSGLDRENSR